MANSFDEKYKKNIDSLAVANNVDTGTAAAMLRSNLAGTSNYKGGGVLDFNLANRDLKASAESTNSGSSTTESDLYALQEKKRLQALDKARQSGLAALKTEKDAVNPYYNTALSTVGGQSATNAKNLQEYLAQRGQTQSGVAAQAEINRLGDLQSSFANIETERANKFADIAKRETEVQNAYDQGAIEAATDRQIAETQAVETAKAAQAQYEQELQTLGYKNDLAKELADYKAQNDLEIALAKIQAQYEANYSLKQLGASLSAKKNSSSSGATMTKDQAYYNDVMQIKGGAVSPATIKANAMELVGQYGYSKYQKLLKAANENYKPSREQLGVADFRALAGEQ